MGGVSTVTLAAILASAVFTASLLLHGAAGPAPVGLEGLAYTDVATIYRELYDNRDLCLRLGEEGADLGRWYDEEALEGVCAGRPVVGAPYVDYKFEYPPIVGAVWYVSTALARSLAGPDLSPLEAGTEPARTKALVTHFTVNAAFNALGLIAVIHSAARLVGVVGASPKRILLLALSPSLLMYATYNWDLLTAGLFMLGLLALVEGRPRTAGVLLGLSVSTKLIPLVAVAVALYELHYSGSRRLEGVAEGLLLAGALPYLAVALASPRGFSEFVAHHAGWYCENCFVLPLLEDLWSPYAKFASVLAITAFASAVVAFEHVEGERSERALVDKCFLALAAAVTFNYVFTPQMLLMVAPLALLLPRSALLLYAIADACNAVFIIAFFENSALAGLLASVGISADEDPWTAGSPTQWIAAVRNYLLILAVLSYAYLKLRPGERVR